NAEPGYATNLPTQFTRFFGREKELAGLQALLAPGGREQRAEGKGYGETEPNPLPHALCPSPSARLVTLTGPGGTGKTRLSLEVARQLVPAYSGAVWFVPLADLTDPRLVPDAILDALRLPRSPGVEPLGQAVEVLSRQPSLLVLDNFEQL